MVQEQRDFIGYGKNIPRVEWPQAARIAVNIVLNYEVGAEFDLQDGDTVRETKGEILSHPLNERNLNTESHYEFGSRAGVWRILRLLEEYQVQGTIFACGRAMERNPEVAREFITLGHDIVGHNYRWEQQWGMDPDYERDQIRRTVKAILNTSGYRIKGWFCLANRSFNTRRILMEEGFLFDSTDWSDDLPHFVDVDGKPFLIVPYNRENNDWRFWRGTFLTGEDFFKCVRECFDMLYKEGATHPNMMTIGIHDRIIGRPGPAKGLEMFLEYARRFPDVWFARRTDLAEWWIQHYGQPAA